jgi:hypothetical protein
MSTLPLILSPGKMNKLDYFEIQKTFWIDLLQGIVMQKLQNLDHRSY